MPEPSCDHVVMDLEGDGCGTGSTMPSGSKPLGESPHEARDMAGNVWEWVADWYELYDAEELDNPMGPVIGTARVVRGGSWRYTYAGYFRTSFRAGHDPAHTADDFGFRCARTPPEAP
jgi:formylglycine-generating enzyme required for sulfatase activity